MGASRGRSAAKELSLERLFARRHRHRVRRGQPRRGGAAGCRSRAPRLAGLDALESLGVARRLRPSLRRRRLRPRPRKPQGPPHTTRGLRRRLRRLGPRRRRRLHDHAPGTTTPRVDSHLPPRLPRQELRPPRLPPRRRPPLPTSLSSSSSRRRRRRRSTAKQLTLAYVSCGFGAFQRDADRLLAAGWRLDSVEGHLLFPGADHVETLAVFRRRGGSS
mmetsp:Transcript_19273/g.59481  ORF Transcript_19273/g.59481 Transcript_19273/m.59481 type:complete len:218 (-) Transcript_19273:32-685(-)